MKHVLRLITVAVILLAVVIGFYEYKRSHTTRETYPGIEDLVEKEPERKVTLLPIAGEDETVNRAEGVVGGDKNVPSKNEGKTENKVTPQILPTVAPTATSEPVATPTVAPTATPVEEKPSEEQQGAEKEPKATPYVLAVENQPGVQEGWGKIKSSITASLTMSSLPLQGAGSVKRVDSTKNLSVLISSEMPIKLYGLYEGEQEKIYRHVGVTYFGNEYYGYVLADRIEECAESEVVLPTPTATVAPMPTETPVWTPTVAPIPTNVPVWVPTSTPVIRPTATTRPTATATPRPTAGPVWVPTATPTARPVATATPVPTPTTRPVATATPRPTATARPVATSTPVPMPTPTTRPVATATPVPTPTACPVATATPMPTATPVPTPIPTSTPVPTATPVPVLELVTAGEYDYRVIPDKYNTGCSGSLTKINSACTVDGVEYILSDNGNTLVIEMYYTKVNNSLPDEVVIRNKDFSDKKFVIRHTDIIDGRKIIRFENCLFGYAGIGGPNDKVEYYFENCTFERFYGSNAVFDQCYFGGSANDGMNPFQNVTVKNSYFAGFPQWNENGIHTDAMQIYGKADIDAENIVFSNCRIEIPVIKEEGRKVLINACLMVALEYSNAQNFLFEDCIINGGGYSIYATDNNGKWKLENIVFSNISLGSGHLYGDVYPHIAEGVMFNNLHDTEQLYVASVWKDSLGKIHLSVTNDTAEDKFLIVVTENGRQEIFIPCKATAEAEGAKEYYDLPIDIEVVTSDAGSNWVICYDGEETEENQIRFVNWGYNEVYREVK